MIIAVEKKNGGFLKVDSNNEVLRELIDANAARPFQGKEMFWIEQDGSHSQNISDELAVRALAFFAAQEEA